jgi:hypothetical protein
MYFRFTSAVSSVSSAGVVNFLGAFGGNMPLTTITSSAGTGDNVITIAAYRSDVTITSTVFTPTPGALPYGTKDYAASGDTEFYTSFNTFKGVSSDVDIDCTSGSSSTQAQGFYLNVS